MFGYLSRYHIGFSTGISVGNEADVDIIDAMEYLATCPHTKVIGLYIETIRRGEKFIEAARSIVPHKPVVAYYVGGSEAGQQASLSHTAALAGPDELYDGVFRQSGIIRAQTIPELFDFCWVLGASPRPAGNRVIIQTHSGGPGAAAADACSRTGLVLAKLSRKTREKLSPLVPATGSMNNPIDLTFSKNPQDYFSIIPSILLAEENCDGLLAYFLAPGQIIRRTMESMDIPPDKIPQLTEKIFDDQAKSVADLIAQHQKPLFGYTFQSHAELYVQKLLKNGVPVFPSPERAARAMAALVDYSLNVGKIKSGIYR